MATYENTGQAEVRSAVEKAAMAVGAVFLLFGILGFIPGITSNYDQLAGAGHHSGALLLGVFQISYLHNAVHLIFGVAGLSMARSVRLARAYLLVGGIIYLALWIYGLVIDHNSAANFIPLNNADNWLHLVLGVGMLVLGLLRTRPNRRNRDTELG